MKFLFEFVRRMRTRNPRPTTRLPHDLTLREWADLPAYHPQCSPE